MIHDFSKETAPLLQAPTGKHMLLICTAIAGIKISHYNMEVSSRN